MAKKNTYISVRDVTPEMLAMPREIQKLSDFDKIKYHVKHYVKFIVDEEYTKIRAYVGVKYPKKSAKVEYVTFSILEFESSYKLRWPSALENEMVYQLLEKLILILSQRINCTVQAKPLNAKYQHKYLIFRPSKARVRQYKLNKF